MAVALMPRSVHRSPDEALTVLYDRHAGALLSFARSYVGDTAAAEDVVQQTFLAAHRTLSAGTEFEQPRAWLFHVARNNALMVLRERGGLRAADAQLSEELEARASAVAEQVEEREELRRLVADIVALPADQRAALTLFELGDLSQAEVAAAIGVERTKVKALVFQARSALTDQRAARDASCTSVREKLATLSGGARNTRLIRNHLRQCAACTAYRDELRDRRRKVALLLPVPLLPGLREAVLGGGAAATGHAGGAALWLTGRAKWLAAGGSSTAAAGVVVATLVLGGGGTAQRAVEPAVAAAATAPPAAATTSAAPQPAARRHPRARPSPRTGRAGTPAAHRDATRAPRIRVKDERVPERTRDAPHPAPERPAPSVTPAPSSAPEPVSTPAPAASAEPTAPAAPVAAPVTAPVTAPAASPEPTVTASPAPAPAPTVWPPGHRDKGDGHPVHPPHP